MKHLGNIMDIKGAEAPIVDIVVGGSPCQDLSIAGKRMGLNGARSGLFMEQIRIIKEMREHDKANRRTDEYIRPRYMVWENVPGAFSSNKGEDFRAVLEETAKIADSNAVIPRPPKGKWSNSGAIMGDGWSIAWRVHDAQFWGVPQRRKRIALVADFAGGTAPEILFERKGMSRDTKESGIPGQGVAADVERSIGETSEPILLESNQNHATIQTDGISTSLPASMGMGGGYIPMITDSERGGKPGGALSTLNNQSVCAFEPGVVVEVETEVEVRKYSVDTKALIECLQSHKTIPIREVAEKLNKPKTLVEHWFRKDKCFAIPDADIWLELKALLGIKTTEFDESIMTFETRPNKFDMTNRIHMGDIGPTLTANGENTMYCIEGNVRGADVYNGELTGEKAATLTAASGASSTHSGPTVVQGFDAYNQASTGDVAMPLRNKAADSDHIPVVCIEGNGQRESHKGDGYKESDIMYTLNTVEQHAVAYRGDAITSPINASNPQPGDPCHTLTADSRNYVVLENHPADSRVKVTEDGMVQTLSSRMGTGGGNVPMVMEPVCVGNGQLAQAKLSEKVGTLNCMHDQQAVLTYQDTVGALCARDYKGIGSQYVEEDKCITQSVVRRLAPLECERLQGFPDGWTDIGDWIDSKGKKHKDADSPRYKALGNSIALPFWEWMAERMINVLKEDGVNEPTMASLFDGIGGFPLVYSRCGCKPIWASEIEEFGIAVTKKHFGED